MSKSTELDKKVKSYILSTIEDDGNGTELNNNAEKCSHLKERFSAEYGWRVNQVGRQKAMIDWLQGLALNIEFMNYRILKLAVLWGSIPDKATTKQENKILDNYWSFMAVKTLQLIDGYRVPKDNQ